MAFNLEFKVVGEAQLSRVFNDLSIKISAWKGIFNSITRDFYSSQKRTFDVEGSHEGKRKWRELSPAYAEWKGSNFPGKNILELSGKLKKAATTKNAEGSLYKVTKTSLLMGVDLKVGGWNLAALHQLGTKKMPAREVVRVSQKQKLRWVRIVRQNVASTIRKVVR